MKKVVLAALMAFMLSACGGGGGSDDSGTDPVPAVSEVQNYFVGQWLQETGNGGPKTYTGVLSFGNNGMTGGDLSLPYTTPNANNEFTISGDPSKFNASRKYFVTVDADKTDGDIGVVIGVKKSTGKTNGSLNGEYVISGPSYSGQVGIDTGDSLIFNGNGSVTYQSETHTYSVASDGGINLTGNNKTLRGQISSDGDMFVLVDDSYKTSTASGNAMQLIVGIRKATSASNLTLSGNYGAAGINYYNDSTRSTSFVNIVSAGNGSATTNKTTNSDGNTGSETFSYSVAPGGTLTLGGLQGIISPDGSIFTLIEDDLISPDGSIGFFISVK